MQGSNGQAGSLTAQQRAAECRALFDSIQRLDSDDIGGPSAVEESVGRLMSDELFFKAVAVQVQVQCLNGAGVVEMPEPGSPESFALIVSSVLEAAVWHLARPEQRMAA